MADRATLPNGVQGWIVADDWRNALCLFKPAVPGLLPFWWASKSIRHGWMDRGGRSSSPERVELRQAA